MENVGSAEWKAHGPGFLHTLGKVKSGRSLCICCISRGRSRLNWLLGSFSIRPASKSWRKGSCLDRPMPGKQLHVTQRTAGLVYQSGSSCDECTAARM
jgi:hypothetical protein